MTEFSKTPYSEQTLQAVVEAAFRGTVETTIDGASGRVFIMRNPPNTVPERYAVKTVLPRATLRRPGDNAQIRFQREAEKWYRVRGHDLILTPFFVKIVDGWPFIAMPYCEHNLADIIAGTVNEAGTIPQRFALAVEISHALDYAYSQGLTAHQDLKPANILVRDLRTTFSLPPDYPIPQQARITDFGLADAYRELGVWSGSRPYMAPEQYAKDISLSAVDVFAFGAILVELLSGLHPIGRRTRDVWPVSAAEEPKKWSHEKPWKEWARNSGKRIAPECSLPQCIDSALLTSMLAIEPSDRPTARDVEMQLSHALKELDPFVWKNLTLRLAKADADARQEKLLDPDNRWRRQNLEQFMKLDFYKKVT